MVQENLELILVDQPVPSLAAQAALVPSMLPSLTNMTMLREMPPGCLASCSAASPLCQSHRVEATVTQYPKRVRGVCAVLLDPNGHSNQETTLLQ
jgi:hypothetical protein